MLCDYDSIPLHSTLSSYLLLCFLLQSASTGGAAKTPLHLAIEGGHLGVAKLLLLKGECASFNGMSLSEPHTKVANNQVTLYDLTPT